MFGCLDMVHRIHDIHDSVYLCALCILHQGSWNKSEEQFIIIPSNQLDYPASSTLSIYLTGLLVPVMQSSW